MGWDEMQESAVTKFRQRYYIVLSWRGEATTKADVSRLCPFVRPVHASCSLEATASGAPDVLSYAGERIPITTRLETSAAVLDVLVAARPESCSRFSCFLGLSGCY